MKNPLLLLACFVLSIQGSVVAQSAQRDLASYLRPGTPDLPTVSAHRGGRFYPGLPENSLGLFQYIVDAAPVIIECDVQLSSDSVLFLLHDDSLQRTTTGTGLARSWRWEELQSLRLVDDFNTVTDEKIPSLASVLRWAKGTVILALDIKEGVPIELLVSMIREYDVTNDVVLIAYNLEEAIMLHEHGPELVLSVSMQAIDDIKAHEAAGIPLRQCVAFTGTRLQSPELYAALRAQGILSILGTMNGADLRLRGGVTEVYEPLYKAGVDMLATDHPIEAYKASQGMIIPVRTRGVPQD